MSHSNSTGLASEIGALARGTWSIRSALPAVTLLCAFVSIWIVQNPAFGLIHDSQIYAFQALARLHPDLYSQDIYLRYGSQDDYTIFSPLFAAAMHVLGVENAAVAFTLLAQAMYFAAAALLARVLVPARFVWLGLGLLCALPCFYGADNKFALAEGFTTPRLFAEAFVMAGLAAFLTRRFWVAGSLGLIALLLHPLMTVPGIVVALCTSTTPPRVRAWAISAGVLAGCAMLAWLAFHGTALRFDDKWMRMLWTALSYLWVSQWPAISWSQTLVCMSTLAIGVLALERSHARSLCRAALIAGIGGIALSYVAVDLLHIVLALQVQPWRWAWMAVLIVTLLAPFIAHRLWSLNTFGRCAVLLLTAAWIWTNQKYAIGIVGLALLATIAATRATAPLPPKTHRLLFIGSALVLVLAVVSHIAALELSARTAPDISMVPWMLRSIRAFSRSGALPFIAFLLICIAVYRFRTTTAQLSIAGVTLLALAAVVPSSLHEWSMRWYDRDFDAFSEWRSIIPPRTEVLWFDSPLSVWLLLQRPSYLSGPQEASAVFSHSAAVALKGRVDKIQTYLYSEPGAAWVDRIEESESARQARAAAPLSLAKLCAEAPDLRFIVTEKNMLAEPVAALPPTVSAPFRELRLYRCDASHG